MIDFGIGLELTRDAELDAHGHPSGSLRVKMFMGGEAVSDVACFHTRERGHRYVRLPPGDYTMMHTVHAVFPDVQCLQPLGLKSPQLSRCLIHPVTRHVRPQDTADALEGCIAPYVVGAEEVAGGSDLAMEQLWRLLGGWKKGKKVSLTIRNDVPAGAL